MGLLYDESYVLGAQLDELMGEQQAHPPTGYMNAYEADLAYGGREEGGWWYEYGTPLASIRFRGEAEALRAFKLLEEAYRDEYDDGRSLSSVISEGDLRIAAEAHYAQPYPETRPRYE